MRLTLDIFFSLINNISVGMKTIRIGVIGVGHLGSSHIRNLQEIEDVEVVGFFDIDDRTASEVADSTGLKSFNSRDELFAEAEAVSIVTPTNTHYEIAASAFEHGLNLFIEKPICDKVEDARKLVEIAKENGRTIQVGHIERFSGTYSALSGMNLKPMFIECHRLMQFQPRNLDIAVVLDLMIHDIDLVLHMNGSKPVKVDANGVSVISDNVDIANARLTFENGCVANLTASRISQKGMRKMRIFQKNSYITLDFLKNETRVYGLGSENSQSKGIKVSEIQLGDQSRGIYLDSPDIVEQNPLLAELTAFVNSIRNDEEPVVTGEDGLAALETASQIITSINNSAM